MRAGRSEDNLRWFSRQNWREVDRGAVGQRKMIVGQKSLKERKISMENELKSA